MTDTPPRRYVIGRWDPLTVGVDIGGTKVLAGVVDSSGRVLERQRRHTPGTSVRDVENTIVDLVLELGRSHDIAAVGVGAAGFVDVTRSVAAGPCCRRPRCDVQARWSRSCDDTV